MRISQTGYRLAVVLIALAPLLSATGGARAAEPMAPSVTARLSDDDPTATVRPTCVPSDDDDDCDGQHTAAVKTARLVSALSMQWLRSDTIGWLTAATRAIFTAAFVSAIAVWPQEWQRK
jgi:hypothetical protein